MGFLLVVDMGTTNVKGALVELEKGSVLGTSSYRINLYTQEAQGAAEQDPEEIYTAVKTVVRNLARLKPGGVEAIFLTSQMHAFGLLSGNGEPVTRLLTYFDTRSRRVLRRIEERGYELYRETGCPPLHVYPLSKALLAREMGWLTSSNRVMLSAKDYVLLKLTGEHALDLSTASGSQLLNIWTLRWSETALELAGLSEEQLPRLVEGAREPLPLNPSFAEETGLAPGTEVYAGVSDASANQYGVGATSSQVLAMNLGTSAAVRFLVEKPVIDDRRMRFFSYYAGSGKYLAGGAVNNGGVVVEWFLRSLGRVEAEYSRLSGNLYELIDALASSSPPGANGLVALPFLLGGERFPLRNPEAKGVLYGLQWHHTRGDILRSLMEGVVFTLKMIYEALTEHGLSARFIGMGGGGAESKVWRRITADVFAMPVYRAPSIDATLAGALTHYATAHGLKAEFEYPREATHPDDGNTQVYRGVYQTYLRLVRLLYGEKVNAEEARS